MTTPTSDRPCTPTPECTNVRTPIEHAAEIIAKTFPGWDNYDDDLRDDVNAECMKSGRKIAEALAAAGLIATEQQWAVKHPDIDLVIVMDRYRNPITTEAEAVSLVKQFADGPARVITRNVTPWKDAEA